MSEKNGRDPTMSQLIQRAGNVPTAGVGGRSTPDDKGEIRFAIGLSANGLVCIEFEKPCTWLGLSIEEAAQVGVKLIDYAREGRALRGGLVLPR